MPDPRFRTRVLLIASYQDSSAAGICGTLLPLPARLYWNGQGLISHFKVIPEHESGHPSPENIEEAKGSEFGSLRTISTRFDWCNEVEAEMPKRIGMGMERALSFPETRSARFIRCAGWNLMVRIYQSRGWWSKNRVASCCTFFRPIHLW